MSWLEILWLKMNTQRAESGLFSFRKIKAWESLQSRYAYICLAVWSGVLSCINYYTVEIRFHHQIERSLLSSQTGWIWALSAHQTLSPTGRAEPLILSSSGTYQPKSCTTKIVLRHLPNRQHIFCHTWGKQSADPVIHHTPRFQCLHSDSRSYLEQQLQLKCCGIIALCSTLTEIFLWL